MLKYFKKQQTVHSNPLKYRKISTPFGVEIIEGFEINKIHNTHIAKIKSLLTQNGLVVIRSSKIWNEQEQLKFTNMLGTADKDVMYIASQLYRQETKERLANLYRSSSQWHCDYSYQKNPSHLSILQMTDISEDNKQTSFFNLNLAYNTLSENQKLEWGNFRVKYSGNGAVHPLIWLHPFTGKPGVYFDFRFALEVFDVCPLTGETLIKDINSTLIGLNKVYSNTKNIYKHYWKPGDIIIMDNYSVARRDTFSLDKNDLPSLRLTTTEGIYF